MCLEDIPFILIFAQRKWIWLARKCDEILRNLMNERYPSGNKLFPLINDDVTYNLTPFYPNQHCLKQTTPAYYFLESCALCVNDSMKTGSFINFITVQIITICWMFWLTLNLLIHDMTQMIHIGQCVYVQLYKEPKSLRLYLQRILYPLFRCSDITPL